ncbi:hypothetical protein PR202_gb04888 [Eleusine coracana subsp. coracana]|uniref:Uncharacterized protein n=1 Tax=Eleusine coracana subsp. coracana TaxID=191504 RepID=A0AAV5E5M3_ELECO|nr:hypothetical protein PR202_gb04888 [Eleusine coracana subsp. coracana]
MRSVDASKCHPFAGGCGEGEEEPPPPLPPMEPPPRSRWWAHELAAARARLSACDAATEGGRALVLHKGTKRKGSRLTAGAERAKKRRRVLQFRSLLKNKVLLCFTGACAFAWWASTRALGEPQAHW